MRLTPPDSDSTADDRLEALSRSDKWYLADGRGAIWAPPFPVWLREPGFWDPAHLYDAAIGPLFSVALVSADGRELALQQTGRTWRPDRLVCTYLTPDDAEFTEVREMLPSGRFRSTWSWLGLETPAFLVAFSAQRAGIADRYDRRPDGREIRWQGVADARGGAQMRVLMAMRSQAPGDAPVSSSVQRCQSAVSHPAWRLSPFGESWRAGVGVAGLDLAPGIDNRGLDWLALSVGLDRSTPDGRGVVFEFAAQPATIEPPTDANDLDHWHRHFDGYPVFDSSDPYLSRYFDYRLYGLHLCEVDGPIGHLAHPAVAEGIEYFHVPISYSGQCHMLETRWSESPEVARGTLLNFLDNQKPDGSLHGRIYTNGLANTDFYHANWGDALLAVDAIHPDDAYLRRGYQGLSRYFGWLMSTRDAQGSGAVDVINHFEAGQEYMSRYQVVNASADADGWANRTRLKGIDATVYAYQLARALGRIARRLGDAAGHRAHADAASRIGSAILNRMWDPATGLFSDLEPTGLERTGVKAAVCFYPMLTDLPTTEHLQAMLEHLCNPEEFDTPWPLPSSSVDDPKFDPHARWQGKRHLCPWNGRVWPMTTSHVIEGLIRQHRRHDAIDPATRSACGELAGRWIGRFIRMMFHDGDLSRPNCFEHYNPYSGQPCEYRGIDDYQHSWVVDLIMTGVMGIGVRVEEGGQAALVIDPVPMDIGYARVDRVIIRGRRLAVTRREDRVEIDLDGQRHESQVGRPIAAPLTEPVSAPVYVTPGVQPPRPRGKQTTLDPSPAAE